MEKVKFGIMGCGRIAARFAEALRVSEYGEAYACAARELSRAEAFAQEHACTKAYGNYEEMLADPAVEAVYIATVNNTHAPYAQMCINAGKAVLCEKPFFMCRKDAEETFALAKEKDILCMEGFWTRTVPSFLKMREWIDSGRIGELKLIRAGFCFRMPYNEQTKNNRLFLPELGGGSFLDVGVYPYEFVTGLMRREPDRFDISVVRGVTGVDLTTSFNMIYDNGTIAACMSSIEVSMPSDGVICGSDGMIRHTHFYGCGTCTLYDGKGQELESFTDSEHEGFLYEIEHFASLYRNGETESSLIPHKDTIAFAARAEEILP